MSQLCWHGGPEEEMNKFMLARLSLKDFLPELIDDGERTIERSHVGNKLFPISRLPEIEKRFMSTWGKLVIKMLQFLAPYAAHSAALQEMYNGWATGDSVGLLAKDAIFEGVGMYWTLRDTSEHWTSRMERGDVPPPTKSDVVKAWDETERKRTEFSRLRAKHYLGKETSDAITLSDDAYKVFNTHACQVGFVLAASSLALHGECGLDDLDLLFEKLIEGANAALNSAPVGRKVVRRTVFAKREKYPLNLIRKLDTPLSVYFRYFWLELLATDAAAAACGESVKRTLIFQLRDESRGFYLDYLESETVKSLKIATPSKSKSELRAKAAKSAVEQLRKPLGKWFDVSDEDFDQWLQSRGAKKTQPVENGDDDDTGEEAEAEAEIVGMPNEVETVDDILGSVGEGEA